jgi:hypothetical protein
MDPTRVQAFLFHCKIRKRALLAELFSTYKAREQTANIPQGSLINDFVDLLFPETINNPSQRALQRQRKARKEAKMTFKSWIQLGEPWAALIDRFGLGILVLIPKDLTDDE